MTNTDRFMEIHSDVRSVAGYLGWKHSEVMEADDIEQEIWLYLIEKDVIQEFVNKDFEQRREALTRVGAQAVFREKQSKALFNGVVEYGAAEIRKSVDKVFKALFVDERQPEGSSVHKDNFLEGVEILTERNSRYMDVLMKKFGEGEKIADRKLVTRAVDALTDAMNTAHRMRHVEYEDGPGSRKAISNGAAYVIKAREYGGDWQGIRGNNEF